MMLYCRDVVQVCYICTTTKDPKNKVNLRFRLRDGRDIQLFHVSEIMVAPFYWDSLQQTIKARVLFNENERVKFNHAVAERKNLIAQIYENSTKDTSSSDWLEKEIQHHLSPQITLNEWSFMELFDQFTEGRRVTKGRRQMIRVVGRMMARCQFYCQKIKGVPYTLNLDSYSVEDIKI